MNDDRLAMRIDHMLLAVGDLEAATDGFRERLGMNVTIGGVHPGGGTYNSLAHVRSAYLELIAVNDPSAEKASRFVRHLRTGDAPYTFALAVSDIDETLRLIRERGLDAEPTYDGSRRTPGGTLLRWRAAFLRPGRISPGDDSPPLPFIIQWINDDAGHGWFQERISLSEHPVGWGAAESILIASPQPDALVAEYRQLLGWMNAPADAAPGLRLILPNGKSVNPSLGPSPDVRVVGPSDVTTNPSIGIAIERRLRDHGAGIIGCAMRVENVRGVANAIAARGTRVDVQEDGAFAAVYPPSANGILLLLVPHSSAKE